MSESTTMTAGLSAQDVKALRQADTVCFYYDNTRGVVVSQAVGCKRVKNAGPYEERERRHEVNVRGVVSGTGVSYGAEGYRCFQMIHCAQSSETWRTVVSCLKAGDVLTLRWSADGYRNGYVERARVAEARRDGDPAGLGEALHADALYLEVERRSPETARKASRPRKLVFLLDVSVCVDNSARMVRRG